MIHTPGHSPGGIALWEAATGVLFSGDVLYDGPLVEDTYHAREHATLGMKPIDRFGLDLSRIRYLVASAFNAELFFLEDTRKVRADNTFLFNNVRYEAPRDLRGMTISIRYDRYQPASAPAVYHGGQRLGLAEALDAVANDRRPFPSF